MAVLAGCTNLPQQGGTHQVVVRSTGQVVQQVQQQPQAPRYSLSVGTTAGAVIGAVVGHKVGGGKMIPTIAGAVVGAGLADGGQHQGVTGNQFGGGHYGFYGNREHPGITQARNAGIEMAARERLREAEEAAYSEGCTRGGGCGEGRTRRPWKFVPNW